MNKTILLCLAFLVFSTQPVLAATDRRSDALQLYQEGLFQETGTGDLKMAIHIYSQIVKTYPDYQDLTVVALYHLGLVHEKLGNPEQARQAYQTIVRSHADQTKLANQARLKLKHLAENDDVELVTPPLDETPEPIPEPILSDQTPLKPEPAELPEPRPELFPSQVGVGLNWVGLQASYRTNKNLQLEVLLQTQNREYTLGARSAFYSEPLSLAFPFSLYTGVDYHWVLNPSASAKYYVGGFGGGEIRSFNRIGIGADVGYYYVNEKSGAHTEISTSVLTRMHVTLYF